jgi:uncharacterized cupredoxin-like copper-binding protein
MKPSVPRRLPVHRKSLALIAALCAVAIPLTLAACGSDDETTTAASDTTEPITTDQTTTDETTTEDATTAASGGAETVDISEIEYKIDPSDPTVKAGEVTFAIKNDGTTVHNLEVEGNGVEEVSDDIQGGQSTDLTVSLEPGSYEMYCAIDGHKDLGMEGEITVE